MVGRKALRRLPAVAFLQHRQEAANGDVVGEAAAHAERNEQG